MGEEFDRSICLDRKLTEDETRELRITLMPYFLAEGGMESDDINDFLDYTFTMVSNSKTIEYIVGELDGFCSPEVSKKIGKQLADSILQLKGGMGGDEKDEDEGKDKAEEDADGEGVDSSVTKPSEEKGNALTMSGALGASREGGRNKKDDNSKKNKQPKEKQGGKDRRRNDKGEGKRGRGIERPAEVFDRLSNGDRDGRGRGRRDDRGGDGRGRGRRDDRGGDGRGHGRRDERGGDRGHVRGGPRDIGPRGGRDAGRFGRGRDMSGKRRGRDDFVEDYDRGTVVEGRGAHGRGRGRVGPKRPRYDEGYNEGYDEGYGYDYGHGHGAGYYDGGYYPPMRGGRGRGRGRGRFGRGRGRGPITGEGASEANTDSNPPASSGEAGGEGEHPSPMVQASYGGRGGFGGRGFGRGGRGRGRGRFFAGRAHVVQAIQSKTWVRKKDGDESGGGEDKGGTTES